MIVLGLILLGLVLGSFINAMVWRFHEQATIQEHGPKKKDLSLRELSMVHGRSMCSKCHHPLSVADLIPLFSWLWLRGKCRYCKQSIDDSPIIEAVLPILFVVSYVSWPFALTGSGLYLFIFWLIFVAGFMALAVYDLRWYLLPNRIVFPLVGLAVVQLAGELVLFDGGWSRLINALGGVAIASGIFFILYQVSKGTWIGGGDVKIGLFIGILVGGPVPAMLVLFIASVIGTIAVLPQVITKKSGRATKIPFGPYLLLATFVVVLFGQRLIEAYYQALGVA
jgi:prepilin signal peptidase PulO-like enzyme (type II secretory pathway)